MYPSTNETLGMIYQKEQTTFRLWSPIKDDVKLCLYDNANILQRTEYEMNKSNEGVHELIIEGNLEGFYYTYLIDGISEVTDPYSLASSLNSIRSAIVDLDKTNPEGWLEHSVPRLKHHTDAIIYELHIKDFTFDESSNVVNKGKFLGLKELNTSYEGFSTGLSHLIELGVTHVHLMPVYDFLTVKEDREFFNEDGNYNWGYDPELYNNVEGSYSTFPDNPKSRIYELKQMIMALHEAGIQVILDVVYNHTYRGGESNFNIIMPGYFHRFDGAGNYSNGSGCGNEIASENTMVRKFIIDSVKFWLDEYKIDGFRFDLMALTDIETMEGVVKTLRESRPDILIYGEPWSGGLSTLPYEDMPVKGTQNKLGVAMFNDEFRDSIKGDNNGFVRGFAQGDNKFKIGVEAGIAGSINYDQYRIGFTQSPKETINYINAHDDLILFDKMKRIFPTRDRDELESLNKLAFGILLTSQGIPFFHAGNEFLRSKSMIPNTYNAPSSINNLDWTLKAEEPGFYKYFKDLIKLRNDYGVFRLTTATEIRKQLKFLEGNENLVIAYTLKRLNNDLLLVVHNARDDSMTIDSSYLRKHLKTFQATETETIKVEKIFDHSGRVTNQVVDGNLIHVRGLSTEVYYISV